MGGDARIGADGDIADIQSSDFRGNLAETVLLLQQVSHGQQHSLPIRGGANPLFIPDQKRKAQLFFQRVDQLAHAGGGIVDLLGRLGKAAGFHRRNKCLVSGVLHSTPSIYIKNYLK